MVWFSVHAVMALDIFKIQNVNVVQNAGALGISKRMEKKIQIFPSGIFDCKACLSLSSRWKRLIFTLKAISPYKVRVSSHLLTYSVKRRKSQRIITKGLRILFISDILAWSGDC